MLETIHRVGGRMVQAICGIMGYPVAPQAWGILDMPCCRNRNFGNLPFGYTASVPRY